MKHQLEIEEIAIPVDKQEKEARANARDKYGLTIDDKLRILQRIDDCPRGNIEALRQELNLTADAVHRIRTERIEGKLVTSNPELVEDAARRETIALRKEVKRLSRLVEFIKNERSIDQIIGHINKSIKKIE